MFTTEISTSLLPAFTAGLISICHGAVQTPPTYVPFTFTFAIAVSCPRWRTIALPFGASASVTTVL